MSKKQNNELDLYMRPYAILSNSVVHRNMVDTIRDWAKGELSYRNKEVVPETLDAANKALETDATWFHCKFDKDDCHKVVELTPITSIAQAKELGFKPYKVPGFPKGFDPKDQVGCQHFNYGQLYAAWRGAFEKLLYDPNDDFPSVYDIRGYTDNSGEQVDCGVDEVEDLFRNMAELGDEVSAMCVDFYWNDSWSNYADYAGYGFHVEAGLIDKEDIVKKFIPKGAEKFVSREVAEQNKLVESARTAKQVKNYFSSAGKKVPEIVYREEGDVPGEEETTLVVKPEGLSYACKLVRDGNCWLCYGVDRDDFGNVQFGSDDGYDTIEDAIHDCIGSDLGDIKDDIGLPKGFTPENIGKARELAKALTDHLKACGLKLAFDLADDNLFLVPKGTTWDDDTPKGCTEANGSVIKEMARQTTLTKKGDLVAINLDDAGQNFYGELYYPKAK